MPACRRVRRARRPAQAMVETHHLRMRPSPIAQTTVVARLTGADPDAVRRVAHTASSPADLPPARALLEQLAEVMRIDGALTGWSDAPELEGSVRVERS